MDGILDTATCIALQLFLNSERAGFIDKAGPAELGMHRAVPFSSWSGLYLVHGSQIFMSPFGPEEVLHVLAEGTTAHDPLHIDRIGGAGDGPLEVRRSQKKKRAQLSGSGKQPQRHKHACYLS